MSLGNEFTATVHENAAGVEPALSLAVTTTVKVFPPFAAVGAPEAVSFAPDAGLRANQDAPERAKLYGDCPPVTVTDTVKVEPTFTDAPEQLPVMCRSGGEMTTLQGEPPAVWPLLVTCIVKP